MQRIYTIEFLGYCPELGENNYIDVKFVEIRMLGALRPGYKKTGFYCEHCADHGCDTENNRQGRQGGCPIFNSADYNG